MRLLDGPGGGQSFLVSRCPLFVRAVETPTLIPGEGEWNVLDLPDDVPEVGEVIHVYGRLKGTFSEAFYCGPSRSSGGYAQFADYRHVPINDTQRLVLRDNDTWAQWCRDKAIELGIQIPEPGVRSPGLATTTGEDPMESQEQHGTEGELREEDVTQSDNLDDKVSEGADLPPARAGGTAEGEDAPAETPDADE